MEKYFDIEEKNGEIFIVDNTACHIDGEQFKYRQTYKGEAEILCQVLNDLSKQSNVLSDIMNIVHNIKYSNWEWEDLIDYLYVGKSMDEIWIKYDDIHKNLMEMIE